MTNIELIHDSYGASSLAGLGQVSISSDISTWGAAQWGLVLAGSYLAYKLINDAKSVGGKVLKGTKKTRRKVAKAATSGTSKIGTIVTVGALAAAGYIGYELYTNQSGGSQ